ncbi:DUF2634 domain-containing protein [Lentibacillus cibarius]|uniref:DUF2634 domain-containing protein n=1 Tax=Lentibacillus cibarius TaxID=2583219 RepID=A0A549YFT3_9BACI|nr:DUF2634 domain-containing protein [Lentibacillus cibarius]TRM10697.1 DUF2634 domain-containing protein [Lentibacillus cibarius]
MEDIVTVDFIQGLLTGIILSLVSFLGRTVWNKFKGYRENKKRLFYYIWKPENPMLNDDEIIKKISDYKKTWKMTMNEEGFDVVIDSSEMIDGFDAFEQCIIKLLNTERDKYEIYSTNYGVSYILTDANSEDEFKSMAFIVAKEIMKNQEEWIKEIHSIKKVKDKNIIVIELGLKGIHEIVKIKAIVIPSKMRHKE